MINLAPGDFVALDLAGWRGKPTGITVILFCMRIRGQIAVMRSPSGKVEQYPIGHFATKWRLATDEERDAWLKTHRELHGGLTGKD